MPDRTNGVITGLSENTEYLITVTAITEEYFDQLPHGDPAKKSRVLPHSRLPEEHAWLPSSTIIVTTSGTEPPKGLRVQNSNIDSVTISWKPVVVSGSNRYFISFNP